MLRSDFMEAEMLRRAKAGEEFARTIAPFDPHSTDGSHYVEAFTTSSGKRGGVNHDRAYGRLENTDAAAVWVELGSRNNPAHHVLGKALDVMGA